MVGEFLKTESGELEEEILCFGERIEEYYGKSFDEVCAERDCFGEEIKEIDFGGPVGEEYW